MKEAKTFSDWCASCRVHLCHRERDYTLVICPCQANKLALDKIIFKVYIASMKPVTINDAARIKGVTRQAVQAAIKSGKLATVTIDIPSRMIVRQSLNQWKPNNNMKRAGRPRREAK